MLNAAADFIRAHDDFVLIAHVSPDGDTLGSSLALYAGLRKLGKRATVVCEDPVPAIYRFLPYADVIRTPDKVASAPAVVTVDCADIARTGASKPLVDAAQFSLNIDHHRTNDAFLKNNFVAYVAATGELIFQLLLELKVPIDREIAACLYAAIVTDTGNLAYSNTTPDTLRIVAELLESGIDLPELNRAIYRTIPLHKMKLLGIVINKTQIYLNGRIGISALTREDMESCGALNEDTEGAVDSIRDIDTVEIAALLREAEDRSVRVSLRAKRSADVSKIATRFGGGGHRLAAGCTLSCPLPEAADAILAAATALLTGADG